MVIRSRRLFYNLLALEDKDGRSIRNVEFRMTSDAESSQKNGLLIYTVLKRNLYLGSYAVGDRAGTY
jgi:hypothetical protein